MAESTSATLALRRFARVYLIVMAKTPTAGKVKTRLCPPCQPEQAAELAAAALADTLEAAQASGADEVVLALAGHPGPWVPSGVRVVEQRGATFDERLAQAWSDIGGPSFQIGMDTPQVDPYLLNDAMSRFDDPEVHATLGPADDGGWWGLGLRRPDPQVFLGVPMSSDRTGEAQRKRLDQLGLCTQELATLTDVDTIDDARRVATAHPATRFARTFTSYEFSAS